MEKDGRITTLNWIINIGVTILFIYLAMRGIDDLTGTYKIDETVRNTKELRIALEKYYQKTGSYPELTKEGANINLHILDYIDSKGRKISFAEIYGRKTLAKTYGSNSIIASNNVYDVQDFENTTKTGGWNYNYSQKTGEIHPNLPEDIYLEKVNWIRQ
ncbi:hypothetical protein NON08_07650 [Cetobacterium somerae]|uniref:hypothetical protein n=1 Tax=Cetobacterium sp. NK01 TaxID=2993530 RepID=UPI002116BAFA|nr:hypothetical protein [Cetobacterium sp. NK01]MCQ8212395.1 hypothetical protein [Cetobacterium sp. NK01]